jgi:hypothetical protein
MPRQKLKKKVLKKANPLNITICVLCVFVGYVIVMLSSSVNDANSKPGKLDQITDSVNRIAESFELYNQKKFMDPSNPPK